MVLKGARLYYFKSASSVEEVKGVVQLDATSCAKLESGKSSKKKAMFSVSTAKRTYYIYSDALEKSEAWVRALGDAARALSSGEGAKAASALEQLPAGVRASGGVTSEQVKAALRGSSESKASGLSA